MDDIPTKLIKYWDNFFGYNTNINDNYNCNDYDILFNSYLLNHKCECELTDAVCYCIKNNNDYIIYYVKDNNINNETFNVRAKRKLFNLINNFSVIITNGFPLSEDTIPNKILLRYELVRNIYTSNHTHFLSNDMKFSIDDITVFFTNIFYNDLINNKNRLNRLKFSSYILNKFETGVTIDDIILKPNITISPYGRWYWSGTEKVQNDSKARNNIYNKLLKYGKILNIDLINGEPWILSQLSNSQLLKKLIKLRIKLTNKNENILSEMIKNLLNIYIHSVTTPEICYNKFKSNNSIEDVLKLESILGCSILDILNILEEEFAEYNNNIIASYKNNLSVIEFDRRIVNPTTILMKNRDIIKEHRKYLQGHTHDKILLLSQHLYEYTGLIPMFTVHDSVSYFINNHDEAPIIEQINKIAKNIKTPITVEILKNN